MDTIVLNLDASSTILISPSIGKYQQNIGGQTFQGVPFHSYRQTMASRHHCQVAQQHQLFSERGCLQAGFK